MPLDSLENHIYFLLCYIGAQCYIMIKNYQTAQMTVLARPVLCDLGSHVTSQCVGVLTRKMGLECYCEDEIKLMHNE